MLEIKWWLDSSYGTDWLSSESGKAYLDHVYESVLTEGENRQPEEITDLMLEMTNDFITKITEEPSEKPWLEEWIGIDYLKTEQGKRWVVHLGNGMAALAEEKKKRNRKIGCGCLIILVVIIYAVYRWWF